MKSGLRRKVLSGYIKIDQKICNYAHGKDCKGAKNYLMEPSF